MLLIKHPKRNLVLIGSILLTSCGVEDIAKKAAHNTDSMSNQMNTMTDNTTDMKTGMNAMGSDMKTLAREIEDMQKTIDSLQRQVDELGNDARQAVGAGLRDTAWDSLNQAPYIEKKLALAAVYYASFEFQTWKGIGLDSESRRDSLEFDGVSEFFRTVAGLAQKKNYSLSVVSKDNDMNTLYALASIMHFINPNQDLFAQKNDFTTRSMLNILEDGIKKQTHLKQSTTNDGTPSNIEFSQKTQEVQVWWDTAIYMLRLRGNFLSAIVLNKLAKIDFATNLLDERMKQLRLGLGKWQPNLEYYSSLPGAVIELTTYLKESNRSRNFLIEQGIDPKIDPLLKRAVLNISINETAAKRFSKSLDREGETSRNFLKAVSDMQSQLKK